VVARCCGGWSSRTHDVLAAPRPATVASGCRRSSGAGMRPTPLRLAKVRCRRSPRAHEALAALRPAEIHGCRWIPTARVHGALRGGSAWLARSTVARSITARRTSTAAGSALAGSIISISAQQLAQITPCCCLLPQEVDQRRHDVCTISPLCGESGLSAGFRCCCSYLRRLRREGNCLRPLLRRAPPGAIVLLRRRCVGLPSRRLLR